MLVGKIRHLGGFANVISIDGIVRDLHAGSEVYPNETIQTGNGSLIVDFLTGEYLEISSKQIKFLPSNLFGKELEEELEEELEPFYQGHGAPYINDLNEISDI